MSDHVFPLGYTMRAAISRALLGYRRPDDFPRLRWHQLQRGTATYIHEDELRAISDATGGNFVATILAPEGVPMA